MRLAALAGLVTFVALSAACNIASQHRAFEYMPDMTRDPAYKAFAPNSVSADGLTLRLPVAGTIPRGYQPFHYGPGEEEAARAGRELLNPYRATGETLHEGEGLYKTYCLICHGPEGKGDGPLVGKIPTPPSYTSDTVIAFPPGRIYHVITMGSRKMPSYAPQLSPDDRWKIVTYVHSSLQHLDGRSQ
jgi:mono/diheme cytochrome c family protein